MDRRVSDSLKCC